MSENVVTVLLDDLEADIARAAVGLADLAARAARIEAVFPAGQLVEAHGLLDRAENRVRVAAVRSTAGLPTVPAVTIRVGN